MKILEQFGTTEISLVEFTNLKEEEVVDILEVVDHEVGVTKGFGHYIQLAHQIKEALEILHLIDGKGGFDSVRTEIQIGDYEQIFKGYYASFESAFEVETQLYYSKVIPDNFQSRKWYNLHLESVVNSILRMIQYGKEVVIGKYKN